MLVKLQCRLLVRKVLKVQQAQQVLQVPRAQRDHKVKLVLALVLTTNLTTLFQPQTLAGVTWLSTTLT
jgi:hypothetical protein